MDKNSKNKISIKRIVSNALFMIRYAAAYDKKLVMTIMVLFIFTQIAMAVNDTFILKMIIEGLTSKTPFSQIMVILIISLVLVVCHEWINQLLQEWSKAKLIKLSGKIQRTLIEKNGKMDLIYYDNPEYYDTYITVAGNADVMIEKVIWVVSRLIGGFSALIVASFVIMTIDPVIALFPIAGFIVNLLTRFKIEQLHYQWDLENRKALRRADYSKRVFYQPEYAKECKLTDVKQPLRKQFDEALDLAREAGKKYGPKMTWLSLLNWISVFTIFSFFAVPAYLGYLALVVKSIALGDVASTNNAENYVRRKLDQTNFALVDLQQIGQYAEKFRTLLEYEPKIERAEGNTKISGEDSTLCLEHVSFKYPNCEQETLKDISLTIKPGEKIAIVGENGAGKTTFVKLLMRLYDVTGGSIKYGGHDIREYATEDYRKVIGAVFQDYNIYATSLAENVLMRKAEKQDEQRVVDALKMADFEKRLKTLPNGIWTEMTREFSEEGVNLSGGESQKVAIARVFAAGKMGSIAILDEPSSALDPVSEYKLNQNLMENAADATVIFISHRLSTTRMADRIYLFENGRIKEQGTHDELMALGGAYKVMFDRQAQNYLT